MIENDKNLSASLVEENKNLKIELGLLKDAYTQLKKTIVRLEASEEQLKQVFAVVEHSNDAIIGRSLDGLITSWNGGATRMFGYTPEEMIGKKALFLFPSEFQDELDKQLSKIIKGESVSDYDSVRLHKNGARISVAFSISPIKTQNGLIIGASIVLRDVTEHKKIEAALTESEQRYRTLIEAASDQIFMVDRQYKYLSVNKAMSRALNRTSTQMVGNLVDDFYPPEIVVAFKKNLDRVFSSKISIIDLEEKAMSAGQLIDISTTLSPVMDANEHVIAVAGIVRDITERKNAERHIKEMNELRNKFIQIVSHQLRTPLTAVNWNLESILKGDFGKLQETQLEFLTVTHESSLEITRRIHDLLTAMDIEEGRVIYEKNEVFMDSIVAAVTNEMMKKCALRSISCANIIPEKDIPVIHGDGEKIRLVVTKLLENAINYTKDGGKIVVKLLRGNGVVRFEVNDTGVGIPGHEQSRVWNRFFRASNASVMQPDAFGLGLFLAKNFVEAHHGKIGFESKEGVGSTFWFELPIDN